MSEKTLAIYIDGDDTHAYTVNVRGVDLFSDAGLTSPVTFPQTVSADTIWYAALASKPGHRPAITVTVTRDDSVEIPVSGFRSLPASIDLPEGMLSYGPPTTSGGSSAVPDSRLSLSGELTSGDLTGLSISDSAGSDLSWSSGQPQRIVVATPGLYLVQWATDTAADGWQVIYSGNDIDPAAGGFIAAAADPTDTGWAAGGSTVARFIDVTTPPAWNIQHATLAVAASQYLAIDVFRLA